MRDTGIVMVRVDHILQTVINSCDFDWVENYDGDDMDDRRTNFWFDVITHKSGDSGFIRLVNSILDHGWSDDSAVGWEETEDGGHITEGHHRLVAAILLGMDEVPTCPWGNGNGVLSAHHEGGAKHSFLV